MESIKAQLLDRVDDIEERLFKRLNDMEDRIDVLENRLNGHEATKD
jgi:hypothetical protein